MFKLIAFVALLSMAAARPSLVGHSLIPGSVVAIPSAVSHQSTVQIHGSPVVTSLVSSGLPILSSSLLHPHIVGSPLLAPHQIIV